jgi:hypothetical protein
MYSVFHHRALSRYVVLRAAVAGHRGALGTPPVPRARDGRRRRQATGRAGRKCREFFLSVAFNHIVGIQKAGVIITLNQNPRAAIFKAADYGIVGAWQTYLSPLVEALQPMVTAPLR